jgi:uncharacterized protein (TIGR00369 family)
MIERRVGESFARQGLMRHLGAELVAAAGGRCEIACRPRPELTQQHGYVHAGVVAAIADSAAGYAALTLMPEGSEVLTVEYKLNLLAPADGEALHARGRVVRPGRSITVCQSEVVGVRGDQETTCGIALVTLIRRPPADGR